MFKLVFFVPESHLEGVKSALFEAGAGKVGNYDRCAWQVEGQGQFRPLVGSDAFIGSVDQVEMVSEYRVELVCEEPNIIAVVEALKAEHPYETPAYEVTKLELY